MWWTLIISHLHLHWYSLLKLDGTSVKLLVLLKHISWLEPTTTFQENSEKKMVSTETGERQQVPRSMFLFQCHAVPLRQLPQHLIFGTHQREAIADGIQPWELLRWPWHNKNTAWILSKGWTLQIESSLTSLQFNDLIQHVPFFQPPISIVATWAAGSYRVAVSLGHIQRQDKTAATRVLLQH